jgi:hypothetical protein
MAVEQTKGRPNGGRGLAKFPCTLTGRESEGDTICMHVTLKWLDGQLQKCVLAGVGRGVAAVTKGTDPAPPYERENIRWITRFVNDKDMHKPMFNGKSPCTHCPLLALCTASCLAPCVQRGSVPARLPTKYVRQPCTPVDTVKHRYWQEWHEYVVQLYDAITDMCRTCSIACQVSCK